MGQGNGKKRRSSVAKQAEDLASLSLLQVEEALVARVELTERFLKEIDKEITEALRMLDMLGAPWKHGEKTEKEFMRISLNKAMTARKKERRERLLQAWKDVLELREKRVELLKELAALRRE